ncbi:hypothetical protein FM038_001535 [Shewanella eurypsychrophilus]|uniref:Uncharacterized protein n=2 Tax=Shewanella TaxID=22 RepID=A0ABX6V384_9GAMM|nr:hypothetical protein [Shewanella eurypsychrophilus]QPG56252.2 hypothetical protein FM038_001535 [Shewanella eurypsychrophilus]
MTMMKKLLAVSITTALTLGMTACSSDDETETIEVPVPAAPLELSWEREFTAPADGAWYGLNDDRNELDYAGFSEGRPQPAGAQPWKNAQYALGTTTNESQIWYGTAAGVWCYWPMISMAMPMNLMNYETERQACHLMGPKPVGIEDATMPDAQVYMYDVNTQKNLHIGPDTVENGAQFWTDMMNVRGADIGLQTYDTETGDIVDDNTRYTLTFRAAGSHKGIVFMVGSTAVPQTETGNPAEGDFSGVITEGAKVGYNRVLAFDARTAELKYVGYAEFGYDTVRRWKEVSHPDGSEALYWFGGADQSGGQAGQSASQMLRWVGSPDAPFEGGERNGFDIVSDADFNNYGAVGDFTPFTDEEGNQRFVSSAWYHPTKHTPASMLFTNPMPAAGYTKENQAHFEPFFQMSNFDPDPIGAVAAKFGANAVYGDYLYFGSYHQGTTGEYSHILGEFCTGTVEQPSVPAVCNATAEEASHEEFMMKTWRSSQLFRIKLNDIELNADAQADLLYGNEKDWRIDVTNPAGMDSNGSYEFVLEDNLLGKKPLYGKSGYGHEGLVYTWTMAVHDEKLIIGTWNATAGLFDMFDPIEHKNPDSHNYIVMDDTNQPGDATVYKTDGSELHKAIDEMLADGGLPPFLNPLPETSPGDVRAYANNPAYFLYKAVRDQNQDDLLAGHGGWLVVFENTDSPATIVDKHGFDNSCNNGVRNYVVIDEELYLGTASYCNIDKDVNDNARAGLEFYKYTGDNR